MNPRYLLTRHLATTLDLAESARRLLDATLRDGPLCGLMVDDGAAGLLRLGGVDLQGDILVRPGLAEGKLVAHYRRGDRKVFQSTVEALGGAWTPGRAAADGEGLAGQFLLDVLQDSPVCPRRHLQVSDRALEDAATCGFKDADQLALFLLNLDLDEIGDPFGPGESEAEPSLDAVRQSLTGTARVVIHRGRKVRLDRVSTLEGKTEDIDLLIHHARLPGPRRHLIGALETRPA